MAAVAAAMALWAIGLATIDLRGMNDLGLISVLPPIALIAPVVLTVSFAFVLVSQPLRGQIVLLHVLALIVMLYALPTIVEDAPRFNVAWRHVGISEVLTRTGSINPEIDAYFSWPGFFALSAVLTEIVGTSTTMDIVAWAPVAFNLMYLPPLLLVMKAASTDERVVWLGVWMFYVANWIGQDYYAPQAYAYFLYLMILGIVLTWFGRDPDPIRPLPRYWFLPFKPVLEARVRPRQRAALFAVLILLFAVVAASHQLTPFAILGVVLTLVVLRRITTFGLPIVMVVIVGTWLSYMTVSYLQGHLRDIVDRIGSVDTTVAANLTDRFTGSEQHVFVLTVRSGTTLVLWALAAVGTTKRLLAGDRDLTWPFLAAAPFTLFLLQEYGGEILLRIYLFSLPFMAVLAANAVLGYSFRRGLLPFVGILLTGTVFLGGFWVSRYGNERMDLITAAEEAGMRRLYEIAEPGSVLVAASDNIFWRFRDYERYEHAIMTEEILASDIDAVVDRLDESTTGKGYLILSRSQRAAFELRHGIALNAWDQLVREVGQRPELMKVFDNGDVEIFELRIGGPG